MGCHAGLNVSDFFVPGNTTTGPRRSREAGSAVFVGNTGFGYGDIDARRLFRGSQPRFAASFAGGAMTVARRCGAKNEYRGDLGRSSASYDEKAMAEMTLYGLPMYRIGD